MKEKLMIEKTEISHKITIQSELTINYASEIYKTLAEGLKQEGALLISIISPTCVDVTFFQILNSFMTKCRAINKKVFFEINGRDEFVSALMRMGYYDITPTLNSAALKKEG